MNTHKPFPASALLRAGLMTLVAAVAAIGWAPQSMAQTGPNPPERMTYQGYLTDGLGAPLGSPNPKNYDVVFRIWKSESSTAAAERLWTEQQTVTVDNGYFSVLLGEGGGIGESRPALSVVFGDATASDRWVSTTVKGIGAGGADVNILPRLRLLTTPYAFLATKAVSVDGSALNSGTVSDQRLSSNVALKNTANTFTANQTVSANSRLTVLGSQAVGGTAVANGFEQQINGDQRVTGNQSIVGTSTAGTFSGNGTIPIGGIIMWSGASVPSGWALCNGQSSNGRVTPNLINRFVYGGTTAQAATAGGVTGGAATVTLTAAQMPAHNHTVDPTPFSITGGNHRHELDADFGSGVGSSTSGDKVVKNTDGGDSNVYTEYSSTHTHTVNVPSTTSSTAGSSNAHENMPPYYVLAFIMRVQ